MAPTVMAPAMGLGSALCRTRRPLAKAAVLMMIVRRGIVSRESTGQVFAVILPAMECVSNVVPRAVAMLPLRQMTIARKWPAPSTTSVETIQCSWQLASVRGWDCARMRAPV